ncbi:MAG: GntR family transcriptional regulator [Hyphomicrobiales bacterium]|nr:GntR family transcriptional regulator [Hyphomicrobiales bacterium]
MMRMDAYRQFKKCLFSGELKPGQFVSQRELAALIGVPLNPIREAVRQLESEKLINVYPQKGIQIVEGDPKTINDAHDYRLLLEKTAILEFAASAPQETIDGMRQACETALDGLERAPAGVSVLNSSLEAAWDFHEAIIDHLGNQIISHHYRLNSARIRLFRSYTFRSRIKEQLAPSLRKHLAILQACSDRNQKEAVRLITEDVETSRALTLGLKPA